MGDNLTMDELHDHWVRQLKEQEKSEMTRHANVIEKFKSICKQQGVQITDEHLSYVSNTGIVATYPNLLALLDSKMKKDKEGLILTRDLIKNYKPMPSMGSYYGIDYCALVHPFFRRGHIFGNHFPPSFIANFCSYEDVKVQASIALDFDRVRVGNYPHMYMEADTWHGPKFNERVENIADGNVKLTPPLDLDPEQAGWVFGDNYALLINWATNDNVKSFYAKAFKNEKIIVEHQGCKYHPVKYLHAEYDLDKGHFRHFDGALHLHTPAEYLSVRDLNFNHREKIVEQIKPASVKLFKLNGQISADVWMSHVGEFLSANPLITEYFTGRFSTHTQDKINRIRGNPV